MESFCHIVDGRAHHLCHVINENESIALSDASRHDIFMTTRGVADYWKSRLDKEMEERNAFKYRELVIWLERHRSYDTQIIKAIEELGNNTSIRYNP